MFFSLESTSVKDLDLMLKELAFPAAGSVTKLKKWQIGWKTYWTPALEAQSLTPVIYVFFNIIRHKFRNEGVKIKNIFF